MPLEFIAMIGFEISIEETEEVLKVQITLGVEHLPSKREEDQWIKLYYELYKHLTLFGLSQTKPLQILGPLPPTQDH